MKPEDIVIYNGIKMRFDYAESLEDAQSLTHYKSKEVLTLRIRFGAETYPMVTPGIDLCPCCSAARTQFHEPLCEREQCPTCKQQVMSCDCDYLTDSAFHK
jgi:hypothetical protein